VLFDEAEKAHPDVMHMLLQIMEEGRLTDSLGRSVDFRNTVVIITSNLGAHEVKKAGALGFSPSNEEVDYQKLKEMMTALAKKTFKPELLNRLDEMFVFRELTRKDLETIIDLELANIQNRVLGRNIELKIAESARELLLEKGYDKAYGARQLRRTVERFLEDPLAEEILRSSVQNNSLVTVEADGDNESLRFTGVPLPVEEEKTAES
jgi:ATP-dependent Clp protease ATP-binding subunit ClpC